jgi:hypothetical protein
MKTRILFAITLAGAVLGVLPKVAVPQSGQGGNSQGDQGAAIEGTWIQTVTPVGAPAGFTALVWFSAGGATGATGTDDRLMPFALVPTQPISPPTGSWTPADNNTYVSSLNFFSFNDGSHGTQAGTVAYGIQNNITYRLTGYNSLIGKGNSFKCDPNFTPSSCSPYGSITITGTRLIARGASN